MLSNSSSHAGSSSLMVMSDPGKSIQLLGFLFAVFPVLLARPTLSLPTTDSYTDPSISSLSQQCTLKANYSGGKKNTFKDQKEGTDEFNKSTGVKFSVADHKGGKSDQV